MKPKNNYFRRKNVTLSQAMSPLLGWRTYVPTKSNNSLKKRWRMAKSDHIHKMSISFFWCCIFAAIYGIDLLLFWHSTSYLMLINCSSNLCHCFEYSIKVLWNVFSRLLNCFLLLIPFLLPKSTLKVTCNHCRESNSHRRYCKIY